MKSVLSSSLFVSLVFWGHIAIANDALTNCYKDSSRGQFFVNELEEIATNGDTPVLILNAKQQVVGVISVTVKRLASGQTKMASVNKIELCSSLQASSFYYADGLAENLLDWAGAEKDVVEITQDEGLLVVNAQEVKKEKYATLFKAEYKAYDVFSEDTDAANSSEQPDFIKDWGTPKAKGEFYYYIPKNWSSQ